MFFEWPVGHFPVIQRITLFLHIVLYEHEETILPNAFQRDSLKVSFLKSYKEKLQKLTFFQNSFLVSIKLS
jgi:hypothetical protein